MRARNKYLAFQNKKLKGGAEEQWGLTFQEQIKDLCLSSQIRGSHQLVSHIKVETVIEIYPILFVEICILQSPSSDMHSNFFCGIVFSKS